VKLKKKHFFTAMKAKCFTDECAAVQFSSSSLISRRKSFLQAALPGRKTEKKLVR